MNPSNFTPGFAQQRKDRSGKREQTKEELLESVRAERAQRNEARQRTRAATTIQRHWRGFACRKHTRAQLLGAWVKAYASAVSTSAALLPADQLLDRVVPPLLLCFWPPATPHTRHLASHGPHLDISHRAPPPAPAAVRGLIALLIRSILAPDAAANYCAASLDGPRQAQWRWQATRLLLLCCSLIGPASSPEGALLDSAAARLIVLLLDPLQWKMLMADVAAAQDQVQSVLQLVACTPAPILGAAQRLAEAQQASSAAGATAPSAQVAQRVLTTSLQLLRTCPEAALEPFVLRVLCVPRTSVLLSAAAPDLEAGGKLPQQLLQAVAQLAVGGRLRAGQAAAALGNMISLLTAARSALEDTQVACLYCRAVAALLQRTVTALRGKQASGEADVVRSVLAQWRPLGEAGHLEQLRGTLEKVAGSSPAGRAPTPHGQQEYSNFCIALVTHLPTLRELLRTAPPTSTHQQPAPPAAAPPLADVPAPLNTLAFDPAFLPKLWRWLALDLGLPLEAPAEATRGLDVASLHGGFSSLPPHHAAPLGLFCRVLQHLLLVLDDTELHDLQRPFTLGQARAMATSLNTVVFHTFFPVSATQAPPPQHPNTPGHQLLSEYAPLALRALYERDVRRSFCQPLLWVSPYLQMTGGPASSSSTSGRGIWGQRQQPDDGKVRMIGGFNAEAVVACLTVGAAAEEDDDAGQALQAEKGAGRRPASLAGLLRVAPQCVPFSHRVELFRVLLAADKQRGRFHLGHAEGGVPPIKCTIRREALMDDAYSALGSGRAGDLRRRLVVTFVNAAGLLEAGLDQGGLMKEFLEQVVQTGLGGGYGLFQATQQGLAYPCPTADKQHMGLQLLDFLGSMVGKALYEGILLEAALAPFFVLRLQGRAPTFDDLLTLDPDLHRSLTQVKRYDGSVEDLGLSFTAEHDYFGQTISHELLPGKGSDPVTNANRLLYCHLLADWHLTSRLGRPADAFARGLSSVIPLASLRLFNPYEFNELISGGSDTGGLDLEDLMQHTQYSGGYSASSPAVKLFWKVALSLEPQHKGALLKFVTSCSRAPLGGFQHLQPPFTIHKVESPASVLALVGGKDVERLPSASTCYNMLKLPNYRRAATLREKLLYAIGSGAGFELS